MTKKIGFACKWLDEVDPVVEKQIATRGTTITWLNRQTRQFAEKRLADIMVHNVAVTLELLERVAKLPPELHMVRLSSDLLPAYTHADWKDFWQQKDVVSYLEKAFAPIGEYARQNDIRVSFHPGQFCVLASATPSIVERSLEEFEYHAKMAEWMGYGKSFQDFKINVHIAGKLGPMGIRKIYNKLSCVARNCITIENEENAFGVDDCLELTDLLPIVLDVHHHWVKTGEYIQSTDHRIARVIDSWRGIRPVIHYSQSREDVLVEHDSLQLPCMNNLLTQGFKKQKLRAHSDMMWNQAANQWIKSHWQWADIMVEAKAKNLASNKLHSFITEKC